MYCNFLLIQLVTYVTLKPFQNKKGQKNFTGARFSVSFSLLPAIKKDTKNVPLEIILALLILWRLYLYVGTRISALWGMWSLLRSIFLIPRNLIELLSRLYLGTLYISKAKALHNVHPKLRNAINLRRCQLEDTWPQTFPKWPE